MNDEWTEGRAPPEFEAAVRARMELEVVPSLPQWVVDGWEAGDFSWGVGLDDDTGQSVVNVYVSTVRGPVHAAALDGASLGVRRAPDGRWVLAGW